MWTEVAAAGVKALHAGSNACSKDAGPTGDAGVHQHPFISRVSQTPCSISRGPVLLKKRASPMGRSPATALLNDPTNLAEMTDPAFHIVGLILGTRLRGDLLWQLCSRGKAWSLYLFRTGLDGPTCVWVQRDAAWRPQRRSAGCRGAQADAQRG